MNYIIKALIPLCILAVWLSHNTTTGEALVYTIFSFCLGAWFLVGVERRKEWRTAQYRNEAEIKRKAWDMYQEEKELERHQELLEQFSPEEVEMIELGEIWVGASGVAVLYSWGKPDNVIEGSTICKFEYDFEEGRKRPNYWVKLKKTVGGKDLEDLVVVEYNSSTRN